MPLNVYKTQCAPKYKGSDKHASELKAKINGDGLGELWRRLTIQRWRGSFGSTNRRHLGGGAQPRSGDGEGGRNATIVSGATAAATSCSSDAMITEAMIVSVFPNESRLFFRQGGFRKIYMASASRLSSHMFVRTHSDRIFTTKRIE